LEYLLLAYLGLTYCTIRRVNIDSKLTNMRSSFAPPVVELIDGLRTLGFRPIGVLRIRLWFCGDSWFHTAFEQVLVDDQGPWVACVMLERGVTLGRLYFRTVFEDNSLIASQNFQNDMPSQEGIHEQYLETDSCDQLLTLHKDTVAGLIAAGKEPRKAALVDFLEKDQRVGFVFTEKKAAARKRLAGTASGGCLGLLLLYCMKKWEGQGSLVFDVLAILVGICGLVLFCVSVGSRESP
jgi:hypothetical protein